MEEIFNRVGQERNHVIGIPQPHISFTGPVCPMRHPFCSRSTYHFDGAQNTQLMSVCFPHLSQSPSLMKTTIPARHSRMTSMADRHRLEAPERQQIFTPKEPRPLQGEFQSGPLANSNRAYLVQAEHWVQTDPLKFLQIQWWCLEGKTGMGERMGGWAGRKIEMSNQAIKKDVVLLIGMGSVLEALTVSVINPLLLDHSKVRSF